jgi:hypothetical protein
MWLAQTSIGDGIAVVLFATVLFLILFGLVTCVKCLFRLITGKPNPAKLENVLLVLRSDCQEHNEDWEEPEEIRNFALYLHSKLLDAKAGHFADSFHDENESFLCFAGASADKIWVTLEPEVKNHAPSQPKRVIIQCSKKSGGEKIFPQIPWQPGEKPSFQPKPEAHIPERLLRLNDTGRRCAIYGTIGLFAWNTSARVSGQAENDFFETTLGMISAYVVGSIMIFGLSLALVTGMRIRAFGKQVGSYHGDSPMENTLKYVLLAVVAIFGLVFLFIIWN